MNPSNNPSTNQRERTEWFIHDQDWSLMELLPEDETKKCLNPQMLRAGRRLPDSLIDNFESHWELVARRDDVTLNRNQQGQRLEFDRMIITSDAGGGKSKTAQWLEYRLNHPDSP